MSSPTKNVKINTSLVPDSEKCNNKQHDHELERYEVSEHVM
jgi:hypothetical protein